MFQVGGAMSGSFYTLKKFSVLFGVEVDVLIQAWLDEKLRLYVNFGNEIFPCILKRFISPKIHQKTMYDIHYGHDFYQSKDSPSYGILTFIPEIPLSPHLEIQKRFDTGGIDVPVSGDYYEYRYRGHAYGHWIAKPTKVARFSRGKYLLTDKDSVEQRKSPLGDIMVFADNICDYLIFPEPIHIEESSLSVREDDASFLVNQQNFNIKKANNISFESNDSMFFTVPEEYVALYVLMHECCRKEHGVLKPSSVAKPLTSFSGTNFSIDTVKRYSERPEFKRSKDYRVNDKQKMAICYLLIEMCKKKNIEQTSPAMLKELTSIAQSEPYSLSFSFSEDKINEWINKRPKK